MARRLRLIDLLRGYLPLPPPEVLAGLPRLEPYERLAEHWDGLPSVVSTYPELLAALIEAYQVRFQALLDIACGTGALVERLCQHPISAVGLDASAPMIERARAKHIPGADFRQGYFTGFDLERTFDIVTCSGDSLNYAKGMDDIVRAFACVKRHLADGGIFVFDSLTAEQMERGTAITPFLAHPRGQAWRVVNYDPQLGRETSFVAFADAIEIHDRWPLEPEDVHLAAARAGLKVFREVEQKGFELTGLPVYPGRTYYVLGHL